MHSPMRDWLVSWINNRGGLSAAVSQRRSSKVSHLRSSVVRVRDAFRVEPLEPRVLLSADPVFSPLVALFQPDDREMQDRYNNSYNLAANDSPMSSAGAALSLLASVPSTVVVLPANVTATQFLLNVSGVEQGELVLTTGDLPSSLSVGFSQSSNSLWQQNDAPEASAIVFNTLENQSLAMSVGDAGTHDMVDAWSLDLQAAASPLSPSMVPSASLERLSGNSYDLAKLVAKNAGNDLWVGADAALNRLLKYSHATRKFCII